MDVNKEGHGYEFVLHHRELRRVQRIVLTGRYSLKDKVQTCVKFWKATLSEFGAT